MRDTLIGLVIMIAVAGIYFGSRHQPSQVSSQSALLQIQKKLTIKKTKKHSAERKFVRMAKGVQHESTNHRGRKQIQLHGADSRNAESVEQTEKLPSIYQVEGSKTSSAVITAEVDSVDSTLGEAGTSTDNATGNDSSSTPTTDSAPKSVLGVPISSWIRTQKNRLATQPTFAQADGVRLYFNCMEIKKDGPQSLNQRDCEALAVRPENSFRNTY